MVQVTYSMPTAVGIPLTLGNVLINPRATPSGVLTHYLVYMVYPPGGHGISNTCNIMCLVHYLHCSSLYVYPIIGEALEESK